MTPRHSDVTKQEIVTFLRKLTAAIDEDRIGLASVGLPDPVIDSESIHGATMVRAVWHPEFEFLLLDPTLLAMFDDLAAVGLRFDNSKLFGRA